MSSTIGTDPGESSTSAPELSQLRALVARELAGPVRESARWLAEEIRSRHGDAVLGILFYGS